LNTNFVQENDGVTFAKKIIMPQKAWYQDWFNSPYYHKLYFERDSKEAANFIKRLLKKLEPKPGSSMLDIACGKGRHSVILSESGYPVTGIDISVENIEFASQFENPSLEFYQHDMRLPFRINYFNYVFNFFTSFGYFNTRREHDDTIRTIAGCLKEKGILVIDYLNVHYAEENIIHNEEKKIGETSFTLLRWHDDDHFYKKIIIDDVNLTDQLVFTEKVAKFTIGDFTDMLSYQGLQVQEVFGDYYLNKYDLNKTPRMILIASKVKI
jgi:SAM-dependent methyltransferase